MNCHSILASRSCKELSIPLGISRICVRAPNRRIQCYQDTWELAMKCRNPSIRHSSIRSTIGEDRGVWRRVQLIAKLYPFYRNTHSLCGAQHFNLARKRGADHVEVEKRCGAGIPCDSHKSVQADGGGRATGAVALNPWQRGPNQPSAPPAPKICRRSSEYPDITRAQSSDGRAEVRVIPRFTHEVRGESLSIHAEIVLRYIV